MIKIRLSGALIGTLVLCSAVRAADPAPADKLNEYLVDIAGGAVSAGALVGLDKGITQIETSQDLVVALQPVATGDSKSTFGFAITPARTALMPMSGSTYVSNDFFRLLGSVTLSYAQNTATLAGADYRKKGFSVGTVYYFSKDDDPVVIGNRAFKNCITPEMQRNNAQDINAIVTSTALSRDAKQAALEAITGVLNKVLSGCIDDKLKKETRWNAGKASLTYGIAKIGQPGGDDLTLAKTATLNAQYGVGDVSLFSASLRSTRQGLDVTSLGKPGAPSYKNSSLVAARYTYGDRDGTQFRSILEVSNAKSTSPTVYKDSFIYAFGLDRKLASGIWLELRLGRNRGQESGKEQTATLMNLSFTPTLMAFKK